MGTCLLCVHVRMKRRVVTDHMPPQEEQWRVHVGQDWSAMGDDRALRLDAHRAQVIPWSGLQLGQYYIANILGYIDSI